MRLCKKTRRYPYVTAVVLILLLTACAGPRPDETTGNRQATNVAATGSGQSHPAEDVEANAVGELTTTEGPKVQIPGQSYDQAVVAAHKMSGRQSDRLMAESAYVVPHPIRVPVEPLDRENYAHLDPNPVRLVSEDPVSTFSIDVDTGAYSNMRRFLNGGSLPPQDAVRVEELINYFAYDYPVPDGTDTPFSVSTEATVAPWNPDNVLLRVGIKGYEVPAEERPAANLVFLVDVSGSMQSPAKLPLLKNALKMLTRQLTTGDWVSLVVYAGSSGVVLEPTPGNEHAKILGALENLEAGGSTNGASGIRLAYRIAEQGYIKGGINRVLLATDGDFNVGAVDFDALVDIVERQKVGGVSLTTLGFGADNYNDRLMEQLADAGNGNHAYIDTLNEGRKVLVEQMTGTLQTIAKDVKIQVEFNPAVVAEYRLIGYENRMLRREDFNNDRIDAGEIGAGQTVTALYELALVDSSSRLIDPLRYQVGGHPEKVSRNELAFVRLRYKIPGIPGENAGSRLLERPVRTDAVATLDEAGTELRFAAAVAAFGQLLRGGEYTGDYDYADIVELATGSRGADAFGHRGEFLGLVRLAESLSPQVTRVSKK